MSRDLLISRLGVLGFEPAVEPHETVNQLRLTGRVSKAKMPSWLLAIELLDVTASSEPWSVDISKHYFVPKPLVELVKSGSEPVNGTHVLFGWRLILQAPELAQHYESIAETLSKIQAPKTELMEVPLTASPDRNSPVRGKGAQGVLSARVGPAYFQGGGR